MIHSATWVGIKGITRSEKKSQKVKCYTSIYITLLEWQNYGDGEQINDGLEFRMG